MKSIFKDKKNKKTFITPLFEKEEVLQDMSGVKGTSLFLGKYTMREAGVVLRKRNFYKEAKKRNLWPIDFELDSSQYPPLQRLIIYYKEKDPGNIIVDLKIREGFFKAKKDFSLEIKKSKFLVLEWLTLQNPRVNFDTQKTPLPGQKHPGLSLGKKIVDLFYYLARLNKDKGVIAYPAYFHNALLFSRYFEFISPQKKAEIEVIRKTFNKMTFKELAWIVHMECLRDQKGNVYKWEAEEMLLPIDKNLERYFDSKKYKNQVKEARKKLSFSIDWECFKRKIEKNAKVV
jgi:hypothetical protein